MKTIYTDDMKNLEMSYSDLAIFRDDDTLYVDKTEYAYRLVRKKRCR